MDQALSTQPARTALDDWAVAAFGELGSWPHVHRIGLAVTEGGGRQLLFAAAAPTHPPDAVEWCPIDAYDDVPLTSVVRHNELVVGLLDDLDPRFAPFAEAKRAEGSVAIAAVPLTADGAVLGGFILFYDQRPGLAPGEQLRLRQLGEVLGERLAQARRSAGAGRRPRGALTPVPVRYADCEAPADVTAVAEVRGFLRTTLQSWDLAPGVIENALVCVSEMVTNALIHTHGGCHVEVWLEDEVLTTWVHDDGPAGPLVPSAAADPLQIRGRGLRIVEALASRSGRDTEHAVSWFEIDL